AGVEREAGEVALLVVQLEQPAEQRLRAGLRHPQDGEGDVDHRIGVARPLGVEQRDVAGERAAVDGPGVVPQLGSPGGAPQRVDGRGDGPAERRHLHGQTSRLLTYFAFRSMNWRRGSTSSPMSSSNSLEASTASSMVTRRMVRVAGSMVVLQSCSGFISPSPL